MPGAPLTLFSEASWLSALKVRGRRDECSAVGSNQRQSGDAQVLATWIEDECLGAHDLVVDECWATRVALHSRRGVEHHTGGRYRRAEVNGPRAEKGEEKESLTQLGATGFSPESPRVNRSAERRSRHSNSGHIAGRRGRVKHTQRHIGAVDGAHGFNSPAKTTTDFVLVALFEAVTEEVRAGQDQVSAVLRARVK